MRYLITFSYDGSNFFGYQKQPNKRTVQEEIEKILSKINNKKVNIIASGRTDAKVHALNQKAHFDVDKNWDLNDLKNKLNKLLPKDIFIKNIVNVDDNFHARFDIKKKKYVYKLNMGEYNPFDRNYIYQYNKKLNIEKIKEAANALIGEHDFSSFAKLEEPKDCVRTIYEINFNNKNDILEIEFVGNGFLRYMIRNIVGTLIVVGEEKINSNQIKDILEKKDRTSAYKTAEPTGLYLKDVEY